ncbi:hypothetical protein TrCOL_g6663 [Triparma columacea]|jgi:hypothetical protein|uniref:Uncharacterized protein n=1 Tax=Triparma columacea TaxID=722753 RepID=A0A9W7LEV1_9STRA|nr:hypothetical protein TrCOL_g6663 [Triparma columacea]
MFLSAPAYAKFSFAMFAFFAVGIMYDNAYMYGPDSPFGWPMIYWTEAGADQGGAAYWWSRMAAVHMFGFYSGPVLFNAPLESYLKQAMLVSTVTLAVMFHSVKILAPENCVHFIWNAQIALQAYLVVVNAKLLADSANASEMSKLD